MLSLLDDRFTFIPRAYAVINRWERERGPVVLRLGVSRAGRAKLPNDRIDDAVTGELVVVIDGNTHQPWPGNDIDLNGDWSTEAMSFAEVQELLREVRQQESLKSPRSIGMEVISVR